MIPEFKPDVIDVRIQNKNQPQDDLKKQVIDGLLCPSGARRLPTLLLYDAAGLRIYNEITDGVPEYYLFAAEESILKDKADDIARVMHSRSDGTPTTGEVVLELGAGSLRKTSRILLALSRLISDPTLPAPITYYALDLDQHELERNLSQIQTSELGKDLQGKVDTKGMWGTYEGGLKFVGEGGLHLFNMINGISSFSTSFSEFDHTLSEGSSNDNTSTFSDAVDSESSIPTTPDRNRPPLHIFFLGSTLGNFSRKEAADFLRSLPLVAGSGDTLLLGLDHDNDKDLIELAYNDGKGVTKRFIMNGLKAAGRVLGDDDLFKESNWEYLNTYNVEERRHEAYFRSKGAHKIQIPSTEHEINFLADELVEIEVSHKFSDSDAYALFAEADLRAIHRWIDKASHYSLWLLERPPFTFPLLPSLSLYGGTKNTSPDYDDTSSSPFAIPSLKDWELMWTLWDFITMRMIPATMRHQKPIDLRHICLFYFGHVPTFLDIHLSNLLKEPNTEPEEFKVIFERGIDPHVDDPTQCNPHSEVPQHEEDWPTIDTIISFVSRVRARLIKIYEDAQSGKKKMDRKTGRVLFMTLEHESMHAETLLYMLLQKAGTGTISPPGFTTPPWESLALLWDSIPEPKTSTVSLGPATVFIGHDDGESDDTDPEKSANVHQHEFGWDNEHPKRKFDVGEFRIECRPITNGQFYEFYMSQDRSQIEMPASWVEVDGEIQVRTLYGPVPMKIARRWPVLTTYDNLSKYAVVKGGRIPTDPELRLFMDKFNSGYEGGSNVGFRNWHPVPATQGGEKDGGRGHNGGAWEWTSTVFDSYEGFAPSTLYPGYSKDFFDGHHQVVIGGSFVTIPRVADRRSVRNWYQRAYPYAWVTARVAYDVHK